MPKHPDFNPSDISHEDFLDLIRAEEFEQIDPETLELYRKGESDLEQERERAELDDIIQDRDQRKKYSNRLFWLIAGWLISVLLIVMLHGFSWSSFELSTAIITTLIGSTTVSVLGLFAIVANYLFPKR